MSDPFEELGRMGGAGLPVTPLPAEEVRRRGDRMRRRRNALGAAGAAIAVAVVASGALFVGQNLTGTAPVPPASQSSSPSSSAHPPVLTADDLVTADRLPSLADGTLGPWEVFYPPAAPTLSCQANELRSLGAEGTLTREFRAPSRVGPADPPLATVQTAVLAFGDAEAATVAYRTVSDWVQSCEDRVDDSRPMAFNGEPAVHPDVPGGEGLWRNVHLFAPEVCQECDAVWFDRQGVALVGSRLVLVSLTRIGGPLEPEGLDAAMRRTFAVVVEAGRA